MDFLIDAVLLSKAAGKPVKCMWTREDDVHNGRFRPLSAHLLRAGFDGSGKLIAWHHRLVGDRVTPFADPVRYEKAGKKDFILMLGADAKGYDVAHQLVEQVYEDTGMRTAPLRGIGFTANKFATEAFVDEIAYSKGVDPVKYRLELLAKTPRARKVMERAAEMADWGRKRESHGLGTAYIDYSGTQVATVVEISLDRSTGKVRLHNVWCVIDCGVAVQPDNVIAQTQSSIVYGIGLALTERISIRHGAVEQSNFHDYIVPRNGDVPPMHVEVIQTDNHPTGVGQMATPLMTPAVCNAIMALAGVRLRHAPFTEERVRKALA
jgi:isoquinoline 1-oxidoreductase beta subunit